MSWKMSRISSSLLGLLRESDSPADAEQKLENIREEMLECMARFLDGKSVRPAVWGKVLYAKDIQTLWYLRSDVMHMLSQHCGETAASSAIEPITAMFSGLIPAALFASARKRG